ncbi:hypothetical protein Hdeb2414_s0015g00452721 [Helianthus debilis subsp. tardiflorus]
MFFVKSIFHMIHSIFFDSSFSHLTLLDVIAAIFKFVWSKKAIDREKIEDGEASKGEERAGTSKKNWPTSANPNAVRLSCALL